MYNKTIILDFDGTIMRLFTNYDLKQTALMVHNYLKEYDVDFAPEKDVFDAFSLVSSKSLPSSLKEKLLDAVNKILTKAEMEALNSGIITEGFDDFIAFVNKHNLKLGIASNNSGECILEFLNRFCKDLNVPVVGRVARHPELMKPNTYSLEQIATLLSTKNDDIVFVGDNIRDYQCAKSFGADFIALTPTPKKRERIISNGLDTKKVKIVNDFRELIGILA